MLFPILLLASVATAFPQMGHGHGGFPGSHPGETSTAHSTASSPATTSTAFSHATTSSVSSRATTSSISTSVVSATASSATAAISSLPWAPAGPGDIRSPCPALNSLANHYLLPHDGHYITSENATAAFSIGLNIDPVLTANIVVGALAQCTNQTGETCTGFHLGMLNTPHSLEHDGSLSRYDYNFGKGDNRDFNASVWDQVMDIWADATIIDFALMQKARSERFTVANATDVPGWFLPELSTSLGESAFILSVFGDPVLGNARKDWINYWFSNERLPFELGWEATQRGMTSGATVGAMAPKIAAA